MKVLVLGVSGMIGSTTFRVLCGEQSLRVYGSVRNISKSQLPFMRASDNIIFGVDASSYDDLLRAFIHVSPDVIVNCIGVTKHKAEANNILSVIPINTLMPHRLSALCHLFGARLIHVSSDCVFIGDKGRYTEDNFPDAHDLYGRSKALGEVVGHNTITLRTSTIGHELNTRYGLLEWFLSQPKFCKGFKNAIFSGLPTIVFAQIIRDIIISHTKLEGLYHVAANPINKYDLLCLIAKVYRKNIDIEVDTSFKIDRSLDAGKFNAATGYVCPDWGGLVEMMYDDRMSNVSR